MKRRWRFLSILSLISAAFAALSGCGDPFAINANYVPKGAFGTVSPGTTDLGLNGVTEGNFTCPAAGSPNVLPHVDTLHDGSGRYRVCTSTLSTDQILVHGMTSESNTICTFPMQIIDSSHQYFKPDLKTGLPMDQCVQASSSAGANFSFAGVNYNAAIIVEKPNEQAMINCLLSGVFLNCPSYSFGQFR